MRLSRFTSLRRAAAHLTSVHQLNAPLQQPVFWQPAATPEKDRPAAPGQTFSALAAKIRAVAWSFFAEHNRSENYYRRLYCLTSM